MGSQNEPRVADIKDTLYGERCYPQMAYSIPFIYGENMYQTGRHPWNSGIKSNVSERNKEKNIERSSFQNDEEMR